MTITIKYDNDNNFNITADKMNNGHAYEASDGSIFICNRFGPKIAYSINCSSVISDQSEIRFREVDLEITVKQKK